MNKYNENLHHEVLDNGLNVFLFKKEDFTNSFFVLGTPLGSLDVKQVDENNNEISFPTGIAHFLEHKMFENENYDVMDEFTRMGASCNAFTSYEETAYYFSTTNDIVEPLNLLLNYVQELNISEESVEKEKGIINQELSMYKQMSDNNLILETLKSIFHNHPLRIDIGGDETNVNSTTKQLLEECYKLNYHPSRMVLVGVTSDDIDSVMDIIKTNQNNKKFANVNKVKRKIYDEPKDVFRSNYEFNMDIIVPKVCIGFKFEGIKNLELRQKTNWSLKFALNYLFTDINPKYQEWVNKGIMNESYFHDIDVGEDYAVILFKIDCDKIDEFISLIMSEIKNEILINDEIFEGMKKCAFGNAIRSLDDFDSTAIKCMRSFFNNVNFFDTIDVINSIEKEALNNDLKLLNSENSVIVKILPINA